MADDEEASRGSTADDDEEATDEETSRGKTGDDAEATDEETSSGSTADEEATDEEASRGKTGDDAEATDEETSRRKTGDDAEAATDEEAMDGEPADEELKSTGEPDGVPDLAARRGMETRVYEPAEDSGLLADAAVEAVGPDDVVLDVGTGSGYVAARVAAGTGARVVASDVNPHACRAARERLPGEEGAVGGDGRPVNADDGPPIAHVVRADLVGPFRDGAFDVVLFNPPYLPTDPGAEWDDWMERALSGGETGHAVVQRFLPAVPRVLAPGGRVLLLASTLAGVDEVAETAGEAGFSVAAVAEASFPYETLTVLKLVR